MPSYPSDSRLDYTHDHSCDLLHLGLVRNFALVLSTPVSPATLFADTEQPMADEGQRDTLTKVPWWRDVPRPRLLLLVEQPELPAYLPFLDTYHPPLLHFPGSWLTRAAQVAGNSSKRKPFHPRPDPFLKQGQDCSKQPKGRNLKRRWPPSNPRCWGPRCAHPQAPGVIPAHLSHSLWDRGPPSHTARVFPWPVRHALFPVWVTPRAADISPSAALGACLELCAEHNGRDCSLGSREHGSASAEATPSDLLGGMPAPG